MGISGPAEVCCTPNVWPGNKKTWNLGLLFLVPGLPVPPPVPRVPGVPVGSVPDSWPLNDVKSSKCKKKLCQVDLPSKITGLAAILVVIEKQLMVIVQLLTGHHIGSSGLEDPKFSESREPKRECFVYICLHLCTTIFEMVILIDFQLVWEYQLC